MLTEHARAWKRGQVGDSAALGVLPRQLDHDGALAVTGFSHTSPGSMGRRSAAAEESGCDTGPEGRVTLLLRDNRGRQSPLDAAAFA
jgi:hypothetical protein